MFIHDLLHFTGNLHRDHIQEILKNRNDFYDPTYQFDYPSHVPSERAANSKGVRYVRFSILKHASLGRWPARCNFFSIACATESSCVVQLRIAENLIKQIFTRCMPVP